MQPISITFSDVVLSIAGHDPSSGAGVTADLQVFAAHGLFGTSAITALTVQSTLGVRQIEPVSSHFLRAVLDELCADLAPSGIKIGVFGSTANVFAVRAFLEALHAKPDVKYKIPIVLDPILHASSGIDLTGSNNLLALLDSLPLVSWVTPNWKELAALTNLPVTSLTEAEEAASHLGKSFPSLHVVVTAGDCPSPTDLLRLPSGEIHRFPGVHIDSSSTHGTGCAFSSALLCRVVHGDDPIEAVRAAKDYVTEAIRRANPIGGGKGPLNLSWPNTHIYRR